MGGSGEECQDVALVEIITGEYIGAARKYDDQDHSVEMRMFTPETEILLSEAEYQSWTNEMHVGHSRLRSPGA